MKWNLKLKPISKLFPIFHSKPQPKPAATKAAKPSTTPQASSAAPPKLPVPTAPAFLAPRPKPPELLDSVVNFLRQYLACDDHRLHIFALWIAHTWSFQNSPRAVYLDIRSPESHSGKSTCLKLLAMLSAESWLATGADPRTVTSRLLTEERRVKPGKIPELHPPLTLLLDDHHHTLGRSERQGLLAMLCSGFSASVRYASGNADYCLFGPKAFAGRGPLARSLAQRCVPITLLRKRPSEVVARLNPDPSPVAAGLTHGLGQWADEFSNLLAQAGKRVPANLPSDLVLHELSNAEPLIHVADVIGGTWSERARAALVAVYKTDEHSLPLMALNDVRAWFFMKDNPDYLLSRDLIDLLRTQENRPWSGWSRTAGRRLGDLLHTFGISSTNLNFADGKKLKGYVLADLKDAWERYLPPLPYKSVADMPAPRTIGEKKP